MSQDQSESTIDGASCINISPIKRITRSNFFVAIIPITYKVHYGFKATFRMVTLKSSSPNNLHSTSHSQLTNYKSKTLFVLNTESFDLKHLIQNNLYVPEFGLQLLFIVSIYYSWTLVQRQKLKTSIIFRYNVNNSSRNILNSRQTQPSQFS